MQSPLCRHLAALGPTSRHLDMFFFFFLLISPLISNGAGQRPRRPHLPSHASRPPRSPAATPLMTPPQHRHTRPHLAAIQPTPPAPRPPLIDADETLTTPHPPPPHRKLTKPAAATAAAIRRRHPCPQPAPSPSTPPTLKPPRHRHPCSHPADVTTAAT